MRRIGSPRSATRPGLPLQLLPNGYDDVIGPDITANGGGLTLLVSDRPPSPHHARHLSPHRLPTMSERDSFLHLARPLGPAPVGAQPSTAPLNVAIQPQVRATSHATAGHTLLSAGRPVAMR